MLYVFFKVLGWVLLAIFNAIAVWSAIYLFGSGMPGLGVILVILIVAIDWMIIRPGGYPYRYTIPALILLFVLTLYPIYYTVDVAFTNYGTGHIFTRDQVVESLLKQYAPLDTGEVYSYSIFVQIEDLHPTEKFVLLLYHEDTLFLAATPEIESVDVNGVPTLTRAKYQRVANDQATIDGRVYHLVRSFRQPDQFIAIEETVAGQTVVYDYFFSFEDPTTLPNQRFFVSNLYARFLDKVILEHPTLPNIRFGTRYGFRKMVPVQKKYVLDTKTYEVDGKAVLRTVFINTLTGRTLDERDGNFYEIQDDGSRIIVGGYVTYVGLQNFTKLFADPRLSGPFLRIFNWTFIWAFLSVLFTFIIGLMLAMVLNDQRLKGRKVYRTLLIIPWAIPAFISVLVWRVGWFNETYGVINKVLITQVFGGEPIRWLGDAFWAKVAVLIVNTWLGFPYMMTVCLGALQSIPETMYEAAAIDGARRFRQFWKITLPLLMTSVAPLLVGSFAYNFNNFVNIYLLTRGGPAMPDSITNAGSTDILISYTYKLAFQSERGQDFGYAAAISVFIFVIVAGISYVNFRLSGAFEETNR